MRAAAIGFRVRSGRAIAVTMRGPANKPSIIARSEIMLRDPRAPRTWQPYHAVMRLPFDKAEAAVRPVRRRLDRVAERAIADVRRALTDQHITVRGVGIVGGGGADPRQIGNPHIRAHAAEGKLFREVLEAGAAACRLRWRSYSGKTIYDVAARALGVPRATINGRIGALGAGVVRPWSADEKMAAAAALVMLRRKSS